MPITGYRVRNSTYQQFDQQIKVITGFPVLRQIEYKRLSEKCTSEPRFYAFTTKDVMLQMMQMSTDLEGRTMVPC